MLRLSQVGRSNRRFTDDDEGVLVICIDHFTALKESANETCGPILEHRVDLLTQLMMTEGFRQIAVDASGEGDFNLIALGANCKEDDWHIGVGWVFTQLPHQAHTVELWH